MTTTPLHGDSHPDGPKTENDGKQSVGLKKQIGLVSACAIIIGKFCSPVLFLACVDLLLVCFFLFVFVFVLLLCCLRGIFHFGKCLTS